MQPQGRPNTNTMGTKVLLRAPASFRKDQNQPPQVSPMARSSGASRIPPHLRATQCGQLGWLPALTCVGTCWITPGSSGAGHPFQQPAQKPLPSRKIAGGRVERAGKTGSSRFVSCVRLVGPRLHLTHRKHSPWVSVLCHPIIRDLAHGCRP